MANLNGLYSMLSHLSGVPETHDSGRANDEAVTAMRRRGWRSQCIRREFQSDVRRLIVLVPVLVILDHQAATGSIVLHKSEDHCEIRNKVDCRSTVGLSKI